MANDLKATVVSDTVVKLSCKLLHLESQQASTNIAVRILDFRALPQI